MRKLCTYTCVLINQAINLLFSQISCHALFSNSDHNILCSLVCNAWSSYLINSYYESLQFVYRGADWAAIDSFLSLVNWPLLLQGTVSSMSVGRYFVKRGFPRVYSYTRFSNFRINTKYLKRYPKTHSQIIY